MSKSVSIIIPALNPGRTGEELSRRLARQTHVPDEVIVIDSSSTDGSPEHWKRSGYSLIPIDRSDFDHGGTRNLGARQARGDILVFMTQDALPADDEWLGNLIYPLVNEDVAATYARQIPASGASPREQFARHFNYPSTSRIKSREDIATLGIKAFFFSNVCSAVLAERFWEVGGFPQKIIMNEDMTLCAKLLRTGHDVKYVAESEVVHSHEYGLKQQFRRNFDIGVFTTESASHLQGANFGGEGRKFVTGQARYVREKSGSAAVVPVFVEASVKLSAFTLGRLHHIIPLTLKRRLSMHRGFWA